MADSLLTGLLFVLFTVGRIFLSGICKLKPKKKPKTYFFVKNLVLFQPGIAWINTRSPIFRRIPV